MFVTERCFADVTEVTLADEDTINSNININSVLTENVNRTSQGYVAMFGAWGPKLANMLDDA